MIRKLVSTSKFDKLYKKFTKNNSVLKQNIDFALNLLENDAFSIKLTTHKLSGKLHGLLACSCGFDCRIIFTFEKDENLNEFILLLEIGTHDKVY